MTNKKISGGTDERTVLVTGGAIRIGAEIVRAFHSAGWRVVIHYNQSKDAALVLGGALNEARQGSAGVVQGDLGSIEACRTVAADAKNLFGRIDAVVNNASLAPRDGEMGSDVTEWETVFRCNAFAPHHITRMLADELAARSGAVTNLLDIRASTLNPAEGWAIYTASKAALYSLTISDAKELAPRVRVNAVSPGITLPFPGEAWGAAEEAEMRARGVLQKVAAPGDIASAALWLTEAKHITGEVVTVAGGEQFRW